MQCVALRCLALGRGGASLRGGFGLSLSHQGPAAERAVPSEGSPGARGAPGIGLAG